MAGATDTKAGGRSLTLERGLRLLRLLAANPDGMTVTQIAHALGTHRAGVYRLLTPMIDERFVGREPDGRFILAAGLIELASGVRARLQDQAQPVLRELADRLGATAALTLRDGDEAVVALVAEPRDVDLHIVYRRGLRHPIARAASGIAILAGNPPTPDERPEVTVARARGWSRSEGEILPGAIGVAAPVVPPGGGAEASISAVWVEPRDEEQAARVVAAAAARLADAVR